MIKLTVEIVGSDDLLGALKDLAVAFREKGLTPEQRAQLDAMKIKLDANDAAVEEAQKSTGKEE